MVWTSCQSSLPRILRSVKMVPNTDLAHIQHVETTINSIRARLVSRIDLHKQLDMLSQS